MIITMFLKMIQRVGKHLLANIRSTKPVSSPNWLVTYSCHIPVVRSDLFGGGNKNSFNADFFPWTAYKGNSTLCKESGT